VRPKAYRHICHYCSEEFFSANQTYKGRPVQFCPKPKRCAQKFRRDVNDGLQDTFHRRTPRRDLFPTIVPMTVPRDLLRLVENEDATEATYQRVEIPGSDLVDRDNEGDGFLAQFDGFMAACGLFRRDFSSQVCDWLDAGWSIEKDLAARGPHEEFGAKKWLPTDEAWFWWAEYLSALGYSFYGILSIARGLRR
jgi:hypothetical protein